MHKANTPSKYQLKAEAQFKKKLAAYLKAGEELFADFNRAGSPAHVLGIDVQNDETHSWIEQAHFSFMMHRISFANLIGSLHFSPVHHTWVRLVDVGFKPDTDEVIRKPVAVKKSHRERIERAVTQLRKMKG
jgi:hypothetical protein